MTIFLLVAAVLFGTTANFSPICTTGSSPLAPGEGFIPLNGSVETVKRVAAIEYGPDTVGFVYRTTDGKLFTQARSGMPASDQRKIGIVNLLPPHQTGAKYLWSPIVPMKKSPWQDLLIRFC